MSTNQLNPQRVQTHHAKTHAPFVVNLGAATPQLLERDRRSFIEGRSRSRNRKSTKLINARRIVYA